VHLHKRSSSCRYVILSLLGQFAIHITFLITAVRGATAYMPEQCIEPDSTFHPNLVNTVSYMVNMMIQVTESPLEIAR
jgi:cation-transporting ATPase 13A1